jgi:hypothetical protein
MKLTELNNSRSLRKTNKLMESRFGFSLDFSRLDQPTARKLSEALGGKLDAIRQSSYFHQAEKNPRYLEYLLVKENLDKWLDSHSADSEVITEGEVGEAQVVLAAKDMVDSLQDMLESLSKMQNEELPPLVDSIRDQMDSGRADAFNQAVSQALTSLIEQVTQQRQALDQAARTLAGEQAALPAEMPAAPVADASDLDQDEFAATDAETGGTEPAGRELR